MRESNVLEKRENGTVIRLPDSERDFLMMERLADEDIKGKMRGSLLPAYVYSYEDDEGNTVSDLTWEGVKTYANLRKNLKVEIVEHNFNEKDADEYYALCKSVDLITGDERTGIGSQSTTLSNENKDAYARQKALSKAQRNALKAILTTDVWRELILIHLEESNNATRAQCLLSIRESMAAFKLSEARISQYAKQRYGTEEADALDVKQLEQFSKYIMSPGGRRELKGE